MAAFTGMYSYAAFTYGEGRTTRDNDGTYGAILVVHQCWVKDPDNNNRMADNDGSMPVKE